MDAVTVMREQLQQAHEIMEQAVRDLSHEHLHHRLDGSTIQPIAAIYAHTVVDEDSMVNGMLRQRTPLFQTGGWQERLGFEMGDGRQAHAWADTVRLHDLAAVREYAQQVYAATDDYLGTLTESDLDRVIDSGFAGEMALGSFLSTIIVWHAVEHGGEICALKGCLGGKGLPF